MKLDSLVKQKTSRKSNKGGMCEAGEGERGRERHVGGRGSGEKARREESEKKMENNMKRLEQIGALEKERKTGGGERK